MRIASRLGAVIIGAALLAACSTNQPEQSPAPDPKSPQAVQPKSGGTLRFATLRAATTLDPHKSGGISNNWLLGSVYSTLVDYDLQGEFRGELAESWTQESPTTYLFKLRAGVKFHDGTDFDAADVVATIKRMQDPKTAATRKPMADNIASVEIVDPLTVRMGLKESDATFLHALASNTAYILSSQDIEAGVDYNEKANGTGPFILDRWEPERQYILKKNPNFWKAGLPHLDGIDLVVTVDDKARIDALRTGEADLTEYVPWQEVDLLRAEGFELVEHFGLNTFLRLNTNRPPLDNKKVRQALAYVLDRQDILDLAFGGKGRIMTGPLQPAGSPYYRTELENTYTKDWDKAKQLLKEAGYNTPADVPPLEFKVSISAVASQPGKVVQQQLEEFGLKVSWISMDVPTLTKNRADGNFQLMIDGGGMNWPDPDYLRVNFHSVLGTSYAKGAGYKNDRLDQLLEEGARTADVAERQRIYQEAETILLDELPTIFLLWRPQAEAHASYVKDYQVYPDGLGGYNVTRLEYIWLDK